MHRSILALCIWTTAAASAGAQSDSPDMRQRDRYLADMFQKVRANARPLAMDALGWLLEREATPRFLSIIAGLPPTGDKSNGWLVPTRTRYTWKWLAQRLDRGGDGAIAAEDFDGPSEWFKVLDRDRDGALTAADFDWSDKSPLFKANASAKMLFRTIDADGDGQVTPEEWQAFMEKLAQGKDYLGQDDLLPLFLAPKQAAAKPSRPRGVIDATMFRAFFEGDVASIFEGPRPGDRAPDFTLPLQHGKGTLTLSDSFGKRPVVLIFGSFT